MKTNFIGTLNLKQLAKKIIPYLYKLVLVRFMETEIHPKMETYNGNVNTIGKRSCYD